jgi:hypothetical protein
MCKENMLLYQQFRTCPKEAQKPITAGRLKGKTDINPMWRLKVLTEAFGPCGIGWNVSIVRTWIEDSPETAERIANMQVHLKYKYNGEWSEPVEGIGGAMFVEAESKGLHADDDAFKKAYTDAISVACKALGIAADIYYEKDPETKYNSDSDADTPPVEPREPMTYEQAKAFVYKDGKHPDKTLAEIWKTDRNYINELGTSPETPDVVMEALCIIQEEIKKARAEKKG